MVQWSRNERSGQVVQRSKTRGTGRFVDRRNCHGVLWRYAWRGGCRAGQSDWAVLGVYRNWIKEKTLRRMFGPISRIHSGGGDAHHQHSPAKLCQRRHLSGRGKTVCVPGLNCYSCPAASGACPIGSFQSVVGSSKFNFSYYVTGTLILLGVLLGRFVCGFLCPFGW